jgi:crotonobetainyl-CoA:carnitine CoA-transferase CaiB-like acyl-CoA transferase
MLPLLTGIRVIDLTAIILGPFATQTLGDLGADVIKIEPPDGDSMRAIPPIAEPGLSAVFANHNRNKRSLALDLKSESGKEVLRRLIATADVLVHNMRQEAIDRLGFGFEPAKALNPRLIYCAAIGFGRDGPYAGQPAYDDVIQAASGFAGLFQMRDGEPAFAPSIVADKIVGLYAVYAVLAALVHRERMGGAARYVEVPMFEAMTAFSLSEHLAEATFDPDGQLGYHRALFKARKPYRTRDGWMAVLPYTTAHWIRVIGELGRNDIARAPWFLDVTERSRRTDELYALLAETLTTRITDDWLGVFRRLDVPAARVNLPQDLLKDPHHKAVGLFDVNFSASTPVRRSLRLPLSVSGLAVEPDRPPPRLGADARDLLTELGFTPDEVAALAKP